MSKYVIIGGGLAGQRGADGIRKVDAEGSLTLVTAEPHMPYERPPLSKGYLAGEEGLDHVYLKDAAYYEENGIEILSGVKATKLDTAAQSVALENGQELHYEKLLLATGGHAWRLPLPGAELKNVFTLRTIEDADAIRVAARSNKRALVIGGSFIGSEVAASLTQFDLDITVVFLESRLLERIAPPALSDSLRSKFKVHGVRILPQTKPEALEGDGQVQRVKLQGGETLDVDMVVMGVGIRLNTALARDAGLKLNDKGAIIVDETLRTSDPNVYAAGDIAAWPDPTFDKRLRVEHWDVARRQGLRAGRNMAGDEKAYTSLPYFFSDLFDLSFEVWGNLSSWDQTVLRGDLETGSFAFYYFDQGRMVGVLANGRPDEERKPMQTLVKARPAYDDVAAQLGDTTVDLTL